MNRSLYTRPEGKPRTLTVKKRQSVSLVKAGDRPALLVVDKSTECHVTPESVALQMAEHLLYDSFNNLSFLDPQGGTGNLVSALLNCGVDATQITVVERETSLVEAMKNRFSSEHLANVVNTCFLDYAECRQKFDRIITNPPFKYVKKHMAAALSLLAQGGLMVALVPMTYEHPSATTLKLLSPHTFPTARVWTKLIRIQG